MRLFNKLIKAKRKLYHGGFYETVREEPLSQVDLGKAWAEWREQFIASADVDKGGLRLPTEKQNEDYQSKLESDQL